MKEPITVFSNNAICLRGGLVIYFDPFQIPEKRNDADFNFITHPHWDHLSMIDILKVKQEHTNFIVPKEIFEELLDIGISEEFIKVVKPYEEYFFESMSFQTVLACNRNRDYHKKENQLEKLQEQLKQAKPMWFFCQWEGLTRWMLGKQRGLLIRFVLIWLYQLII